MLPRSTCRPRCCRPNLSLCPVVWFWIAGFFHSTKYYIFQHVPFNQLLGLYECAPVIGQTRTFAFIEKFFVSRLIERIEVDHDKHVSIRFRFRTEFQEYSKAVAQ